MSLIDLHSHSTASDGLLSPAELAEHVATQGVKVWALTDHDELAGLDEARAAAACHGVALISGTEISVSWNDRTVHIVGLRVDTSCPALLQGLAALRAGRVERAAAIAASLEKAGIPGSLEGAYALAGERVISRTHFARFLVQHGYASDVQAVFRKYLVRGRPGHVSHRWAQLGEAVGWIRESGGIAVIAHPGRYDLGKAQLHALLAEFREVGGTGLEVVTANHTREQHLLFAGYAGNYGLLASCGSDYHGPGHSYAEIGRLPDLPAQCTPVWYDWPEMAGGGGAG